MILVLDLLKDKHLEVVAENVDQMPNDEYALLRRQGLGASDSSVVLGTQPFKTLDTLIIEKRSRIITDEERAIGEIDNVRKGRDLEPLILQKFGALHGCETPYKPTAMYRLSDFPYLTINFDGVSSEKDILIPVECKFVSTYGDKHYKKDHAIQRERGKVDTGVQCRAYGDVYDKIKAKAEQVGIPAYYYTQLQQQILGLNAPYGYLATLHDKGWELVVYFALRDEEAIRAIQIDGYKAWQRIERTGE